MELDFIAYVNIIYCVLLRVEKGYQDFVVNQILYDTFVKRFGKVDEYVQIQNKSHRSSDE